MTASHEANLNAVHERSLYDLYMSKQCVYTRYKRSTRLLRSLRGKILARRGPCMQANESERIRERALLRQPRARVRISIYIYCLHAT